MGNAQVSGWAVDSLGNPGFSSTVVEGQDAWPMALTVAYRAVCRFLQILRGPPLG